MAKASAGSELFQNCVVCGVPTQQAWRYAKWGYDIFRCQRCGHGTTRIDESFDPGSIYTSDYFQGARRDGYGNYVGSEPVLKAEFRRVVCHLIDRVGTGGRVLEIGCAYGFFLDVASQHFESVGVEVSSDAVASCRERGLEVYQGELTSDFVARHGPFDAVVMLDVIEHLPDPARTLELAYQSTRSGGCVVITTGDWGAPLSRATGRHWRLMTPPQHLHFFTRASLSALLERIGYRQIGYTRPWKLVPLGLAAYQVWRRCGVPLRAPARWSRVGIPVNLFDTMRMTGTKPDD